MKLKTLLTLILCNLIWSLNPVMAKWVLQDFSPPQTAWLRYTSALAAYFLIFPALRKTGDALLCVPTRRRDQLTLAVLGILTFCFAPLLQMSGLADSMASESALITAMEPLMAVLLAWVVLREGVTLVCFATFGLAIAGFALLAQLTPLSQVTSFQTRSHGFGNLLILVSLVGEASYSVLGRKLARGHQPVPLFGSGLLIGVLALTFVSMISSTGPTLLAMGWHQISLKSVFGVLWMGPLGTSFAYLYWLMALSEAPVASVALTLFVQPIFGAASGWLFLGERLSSLQVLGGGIILGAVLLHSLYERLGSR